MTDTIFPALVIFVILLGIALYGLYVSNAAAERLDAERRDRVRPGGDGARVQEDRIENFGTRL